MHLNLPVYDQLAACKNLLIAGMGGGFDVFCGLPIYFELRERGQTVHLANFSFSEIEHLKGGLRLTDTLVGVTHEHTGSFVYFPEHYLAQWFKEKRGLAAGINDYLIKLDKEKVIERISYRLTARCAA